jgi:plastocyanin
MKWLAVGICLATLFSIVANTNAQTTTTIMMRDACDPDSFNAALGPGHCTAGHHGNTLFSDFLSELQTDQNAGAWRFNPMLNATERQFKLVRVDLNSGDQTTIENVGGETHTFTRVENFGGGFKARLNGLTGNSDPAPECAQVLPDGTLAPQPESDTNQFVEAGNTEPGPTAGTAALPTGVSRWECCIHPWMRMVVVVHERDN